MNLEYDWLLLIFLFKSDINIKMKLCWDSWDTPVQTDLLQLASQCYPWSPSGRNNIPRNVQNVTDNMRDALDSLNHVCYIHDRSQSCLREHDIQDFCLYIGWGYQVPVIAFRFICHHRQRDENLVRSLQCLQEKRLMVMLYFHIARRCRGFGILDDVMRRGKNAYFYRLNINPVHYNMFYQIPLHCLPRHVITTCIRPLIDDYCGAMTADLVQHYLLYRLDWFDQAYGSVRLSSDICDNDIGSSYSPDVPRIPPLHGKLGFHKVLEMAAPGTALDTAFGMFVIYEVQSVSVEELCEYGTIAYSGCVMSSDDKSERSKFNILQFAHRLILSVPYHGSHCNRLEVFTACWNLLQEICGPKVRRFEQHATLLVEGCKIQSEMDTAGCHWQDMLLSHYIRASQVTVWPLGGQCTNNPMWLECKGYHINVVTKDLDKVVSLLQPGVEEISRICGPTPCQSSSGFIKKAPVLAA